MLCSEAACNKTSSPGCFLMIDYSGWLLLGRVGVIIVLQSEMPCVRSAGQHSCWPHDFLRSFMQSSSPL